MPLSEGDGCKVGLLAALGLIVFVLEDSEVGLREGVPVCVCITSSYLYQNFYMDICLTDAPKSLNENTPSVIQGLMKRQDQYELYCRTGCWLGSGLAGSSPKHNNSLFTQSLVIQNLFLLGNKRRYFE